MGLGTVNENNGTFLSIAGGFIWNRKADESDPNYNVQKFAKRDGTEGKRQGARYADLEGKIVDVQFRTHQEYGESINVTVEAENEERYIVSISTNNRFSQDMMKFLLKGDLDKPVFMKPYDFIDKEQKRAHGISFRQDGKKVSLRNEDAPSKEGEWFASAGKKEIRRFFEDLSEWFVGEIKEKICPRFSAEEALKSEPKSSGLGNSTEESKEVKEEVKEEAPEQTAPKVTPLKMKQALRGYINENYEGKELPKTLSKEELTKWYNLSLIDEELPWKTEAKAEVKKTDLDGELDKLIPDTDDDNEVPF